MLSGVTGAPIESDPARTWGQFSSLVLNAVQRDLEQNLKTWQELASLTPSNSPKITPLRALDIVGWRLGQVEGRQFDLPVGTTAPTVVLSVGAWSLIENVAGDTQSRPGRQTSPRQPAPPSHPCGKQAGSPDRPSPYADP